MNTYVITETEYGRYYRTRSYKIEAESEEKALDKYECSILEPTISDTDFEYEGAEFQSICQQGVM